MTITDVAAIVDELNTRLAAPGKNGHRVIKPVECVDGFEVSIQASPYHYCSPRSTVGPYSAVELGFPSEQIPSLDQYAEDRDDHTRTVFAYVPINEVAEVLAQHGGLLPIKEED